MNLEALTIIGGGAVLLLVLMVPIVLGIRRNSDRAKSDGPAVSGFGVCLIALQVALMLAAVIVANFGSGAVAAGLLVLSFVGPWAIGRVFKRRGYGLYVPQPNNSLQADRER